jgi:serine/threonine-protein kinase
VIGTRPNQAESVSKGTLVTVFYSAGPHKVPNVVGMTRKHAISTLKAAGFSYSVTHDSQTPSQTGTVLAQSPQAYSRQPQGTTVVITVSSYEEPTPTPTPTPTETPTETPTPTPTETSSPEPSSLISPSAR